MNQRERLIELLGEVGCINETPRLIADYLIENGVVVLPCKVGDTVFSREWSYKNERYEIRSGQANSVRYEASDGYVMVSDGIQYGIYGKTVFLTREEAEKALKEREQG